MEGLLKMIDWSSMMFAACGAILGFVGKILLDLIGDQLKQGRTRRASARHRLGGVLAHVDHKVHRLMECSTTEHQLVCRESCRLARNISREEIAILGESVVTEVREATDLAEKFAETTDMTLAARWHAKYGMLRRRLRV